MSFFRSVLHSGDVLVDRPSGASLFSAPPVSTARARGPVYSPRGQEESQKVKASGIAPTARETPPAARPFLSTRVLSSPTTSASPDARPSKPSRASPPQQPPVPARPSPPLPNTSASSTVSVPAARPPMPATSSPKRPPMPPTPSPKQPPAPRQGTTRPVAIPVPQEMKGAFPNGHVICHAPATSDIHKENLSNYTHKFSSKEQMLKDMQEAAQKGDKVYAIFKTTSLSADEIAEIKKAQKQGIDCAIAMIVDSIIREMNAPKKTDEAIGIKKIVFPKLNHLSPEKLKKYNATRTMENKFVRLSLLQSEALSKNRVVVYEDDNEKRLTGYFSQWVTHQLILDDDSLEKLKGSTLGGLITIIEPDNDCLAHTKNIVNACFTVASALYRSDFKSDLIKSFYLTELWSPPGLVK